MPEKLDNLIAQRIAPAGVDPPGPVDWRGDRGGRLCCMFGVTAVPRCHAGHLWLLWLLWLMRGRLGRRWSAARARRCLSDSFGRTPRASSGLGRRFRGRRTGLACAGYEDLLAPDVDGPCLVARIQQVGPGQRASREQCRDRARHAPVVGRIAVDADRGDLAALTGARPGGLKLADGTGEIA